MSGNIMETVNKVKKVIEEQVRPALQAHNGDIELVELTADGVVKVRLYGACVGCMGSQETMQRIVEVAVRSVYPEVKAVEQVLEVNEELLQEALRILRRNKEQQKN